MTDIERAKSLLYEDGFSCVLCKDDITYTSKNSGISPLIDFLAGNTKLAGFSAADKIVGKAAALLFVLAGVKEVYAMVISEKAVEVFNRYNLKYSYSELTGVIMNRMGNHICPMEQAVEFIDNPNLAFDAIKRKLGI